MRYLITLVYLLATLPASATLNEVDKTQIFSKNMLVNGGFESGKAKWTPNDTADFAVTGSSPMIGLYHATWDADADTDTLVSTAVTIPAGYYGRNMVASCLFTVASGTATNEIQAYDGSNILSEASITSSTTPTRTSVNFIAPSSGSLSLRVYANADEPSVAIDDCYLGPAEGYNVSSVSQATFVGESYFLGTSGCNWARTSATIGAFTTDASCPGPTILTSTLGTWATTDVDLPEQTITNLPPGIYEATFIFNANSSVVSNIAYAINDGTTTCNAVGGSTATTPAGHVVTCSFTYTTAGTRNFELYAASNASTANLNGDVTSPQQHIRFILKRFPLSSEQAYTPDTTNWLVDVNIGGANPALATTSQASYVGIEDAGLTLTNSSAATITARIPCSSTNSPSGTTCSAGSESVGVNFNLPRAGTVEACASFAHTIAPASNSADNGIAATFQIVETASNAQTVLTEGGDRKGTYDQIRASAGGFYMSNARRDCSIFKFASAGEKTLRLMYEQVVVGTINGHSIYADQNASYGGRDIKITVRPLDSVSPAPVLTNMVTTPTSGGVRMASATVNCDSGAAITQQDGSWISSIGNVSGGACAITIAAGTFSATPNCVASTYENGGTAGKMLMVGSKATSSTATNVDCTDDAGSACTSYDASIVCIGER